MSLTFNRDPLGDMPSLMDHWRKRLITEYESKIEGTIPGKCESFGWLYLPDRIKTIIDKRGREYHYYQQNDGVLTPLIALSPTGVQWEEGRERQGIKVTMECVELDPEVFKPNI